MILLYANIITNINMKIKSSSSIGPKSDLNWVQHLITGFREHASLFQLCLLPDKNKIHEIHQTIAN